MKNKLIIIFLMCEIWWVGAAEKPLPKANFDVFLQLGTECFQEILTARFPVSVEKVVLQGINPADSLNWFLENILYNLLTQQGVDSIFISSATRENLYQPKDAIRVEFGNIHLRLTYANEGHWRFKANPSVSRHFEFRIYLKLTDQQNGAVLWSGFGSREYTDQVRSKQLPKLESASMRFTQAKYQNRSIYSRFLEPLMIISTTGGIIYLFYSFRSR